MAVISGVLKGPMGDARVGVVIELRAVRTSATVVIQARSQSVTDATGRYTLSVEPGQYDVMITAAGRQPERVGGIQVMVNSATGTLNDFLTIPGETDLNPAIVATVDGMRAAAAASAAAAKTSENNAAAAMTNALSKVDTAEQRVVGPVLFSRPTRLTSGAAGPLIPDSQGTWALWGRAAGRGSTDFVNHRGNGSGGYWFYDTDGTTITALTYINNLGDLTTIGTLTSTGDQTIKANADTPNLLLRFRDSAGAEKSAIYAQTDVGVINIRWGGTAYAMQGRADGFVSVPFGHTLASALTTPAAVISKTEGLGSSPFHFRGSGSDANFSNPASYSIGTYYGFSVVPTIPTGLSPGVEQGKPVFFVNARTGTASVLNNMYIGSTAVLKTGDYGLGSTVQNNSSNMNIDTALAVGFYSGSGFTSTAGMPPDWPTGTTHGYLVVENLAVSFGTACKQTLTSHPGSQFKPKTWYRLQRAGVWDSWQLLWDTTNTTVDANGFIKKASPIVKLFGDGLCELNDESLGVTTERVSEGVYRVSGTLGFNSDAGWGGVDGGIEIPIDRNKLPLVWVDYEVDEYGDLLLKTFHRVNSTAPKFAQNIKVGYKEGQPIDIPAGRWIDLRVEMPGGDEPEYEPVPEDEVPEVTPEVTEPEVGEEPAPGEVSAPIEETKE